MSDSDDEQTPSPAQRQQRIIDLTIAALGSASPRDASVVRKARRRWWPGRSFPLHSTADIKRADQRLDLLLKRLVAGFALLAVAGQLFIADLVFWRYASCGLNWNLPTESIQTWLGATVIQVLGILYVITRYLFPRRDGASVTNEDLG